MLTRIAGLRGSHYRVDLSEIVLLDDYDFPENREWHPGTEVKSVFFLRGNNYLFMTPLTIDEIQDIIDTHRVF
jgi:hypothetical protein